jgi:hypothetical protein
MPDATMRCQRSGSSSDATQQVQDHAPLLRVVLLVELRDAAGLLELEALVDQQRRVAAVVDDERRARCRPARAAPAPCTTSTPPASRPSTRRPARPADAPANRRADDHGRRRVVLRREDVARDPAHVRAELDQRLDQHRRLHRHVQRAHDLRARQRLRWPRTPRGSPSAPASPAPPAGSPCGRTPPATGPPPCTPAAPFRRSCCHHRAHSSSPPGRDRIPHQRQPRPPLRVGTAQPRREQRRPLRSRVRPAAVPPHPPKPASSSQLRICAPEALPDVAHLLPVLRPAVLHHVHHQQPSARTQRAPRLRQRTSTGSGT